MKRFLKVFLISIVALILTFVPASISFAGVWPADPAPDTDSVVIMEAYSSNVLFEKDANALRYPASTTKILTCLLAIENSSMDEVVEFSSRAVNLEEGAVTIDSIEGEQMRMEDALYGLMLPSGNDCAVAIAEHVAGSVEAFADMMNARAQKIGATNSHFVSPNGLYDDEHYTTAHDMALIAQAAFKNSVFVKIISTQKYIAAPTNKTDEEREFMNTNQLIHPSSKFYDERVIGGKTGFLYESGRCLVSFANQNDLTIITVQLGGNLKEVFSETTPLLDYVYSNFSMQRAAQFENRFSFASSKSKIALDSSAQILMLNSVPLSDVDSTITFAKDLSDEERKKAMENGSYEKGSKLYAIINYEVDGHELGSVNVYSVPKLKISKASFISVKYINVVFVIIFVVLILIITASIIASKKKAPKRRKVSNSSSGRRSSARGSNSTRSSSSRSNSARSSSSRSRR